jgi:ATP-dependent 26S proteasome regulatory subunit
LSAIFFNQGEKAMENMLEALVDELAVRVAKRIAENHENMLEFLKISPQIRFEDIEGLDQHIKDFAEEIVNDALSNATIEVNAEIRT